VVATSWKWWWILPTLSICVFTAVVVNALRNRQPDPVPYEYPLSPPVVEKDPVVADPSPFDPDNDLIYRVPPPKDPIGPTPYLKAMSESALTDDDFGPMLAFQAYGEASFQSNQTARVVVSEMPQLADVDGELPILKPPTTLPIAGSEFILEWLTRPSATYPQSVIDSFDPSKRDPPNFWTIPSIETYHPSIRPDRACALFISLSKPGEPKPIPGSNGSLLQVPPRYVLVPKRIVDPDKIAPWNRPGVPFEFVQDEYGKIMLRITIPEMMDGLTLWMQLVVEDRRVASGCVSTPMIEMHVGSE